MAVISDGGFAGVGPLDPTAGSLGEISWTGISAVNAGISSASGQIVLAIERQVPKDPSIFAFADPQDMDSWSVAESEPFSASEFQWAGVLQTFEVGDRVGVPSGISDISWFDPVTAASRLEEFDIRCGISPSAVSIGSDLFSWNGEDCTVDGERVQGGFLLTSGVD